MSALVAIAQIAANFLILGPLAVAAVIELLPGRRRPKIVPKKILITGATSGIGEALATRYASPSITLALTGRNARALQTVADKCRAKGAQVLTTTLDVVDEDGMRSWIVSVDEQVGGLDLVVANAGVSEVTFGFDPQDASVAEESARKLFAPNVNGVLNTIYPALPAMRLRRHGQIAIVSSMASFLPRAGPYSASKAAVRYLAISLRAGLHADGISVCSIVPGYVKSPMTENVKSTPMMVEMDDAIEAIVKGLEDDVSVIAFPWTMYVLAWTFNIIPPTIFDIFARNGLLPSRMSYVTNKAENQK
ncbi:NAD(P)-binding protein [Gonapodya prolifera JEL478]|uniref:NAD(P)-binding protein n=1 Tax=Gonapodya prolifera (strain JEL478) TaxID=1344416 RepID=A0A139A7L4_GONPJ|nr:NAD(P)-binding protein [Gonapodya prolifera JEL478]|eukprot:KXS12770.1 NAD(P)-binding protein [Gonapodya prolifera JEL478]